MKLQTENYLSSVERLPESGQHIIGQYDQHSIIVYQAYNNNISDWAIKNQKLGGPDYSYNRMSWIKPNFLWMMYRCGWASKENQERVLAIQTDISFFNTILDEAVFSSFDAKYYASHDSWKDEMNTKNVRLQWDPDHDPYGNKLTRRAIQLGLKEEMLENFGKSNIISIEDITPFVREQKVHVDNKQLDKLIVPLEKVYKPGAEALCKKIGITINPAWKTN